MANSYLEKFGFIEPQIKESPSINVGLFVVIPCFDEPDLLASLSSLAACKRPQSDVEIITVINASEDSCNQTKARNSKTLQLAKNWAEQNNRPGFTFHFIAHQNLPKKHAGVGLARKIGMDEVVHRIEQIGLKEAPILCFDADSTCDPNYLVEIEAAFKNQPNAKAASIYFEHPIEGTKFSPLVYESIANYELHLRYYKNALEYTGHPQACYTIGSSMAVMSSAYESQGGMNKRKAGEDFYFMQKIVERFPVLEINSTRVIPSPRPSNRVPFGTGRAILEFQEGKNSNETYAFQSFLDLKSFMDCIPQFYEDMSVGKLTYSERIPVSVRDFLIHQNFGERVPDLLQYGKSWETFRNRFFNWFNAFRALKYIHFAREHYYPNQHLNEAVLNLLKTKGTHPTASTTTIELLEFIRSSDRLQHY